MSMTLELEAKRNALDKKLARLSITDRQKDLLTGIFNSRANDDLNDIGSRLEPPMSGNAARQMMYRLRVQYRTKKRFTNAYEEVEKILKSRKFELL